MSQLNNDPSFSITINTDDISDIEDTPSLVSCDVGIYGVSNIASSATLVSNGWSYNSPFSNMDENAFVLGAEDDSGSTDLYVIEKWQSHKPIDMGDGLYTSFKEDLLTQDEIKEKIYNKLEEQYPEKAIKVGLNKDLTIRKYSIPIEIKMKEN